MYQLIKDIFKTDISSLTITEKEDIIARILAKLIEKFENKGYTFKEFKISFSDENSGSFEPQTSTFYFTDQMLNDPLSFLHIIWHEFKHYMQNSMDEETEIHSHFSLSTFYTLINYLINNATKKENDYLYDMEGQSILDVAEKFPKFHPMLKHFFSYYYLQEYEIDARQFEEKQIQRLLVLIENDQDLTLEEKQEFIERVTRHSLTNKKKTDAFCQGEENIFSENVRDELKVENRKLIKEFFEKNPNFFDEIKNASEIVLYLYLRELDFLTESAIFLYDDEEYIKKLFDGLLAINNKSVAYRYLRLIYCYCAEDVLTSEQVAKFEQLVNSKEIFEKLNQFKEANNKHMENLLNSYQDTVDASLNV